MNISLDGWKDLSDQEFEEEVKIGEEGLVIVGEDEEGSDLMVIDQCREDSGDDSNYSKHFRGFSASEVVWLLWMGDISPVVVLSQWVGLIFCFASVPRPVACVHC